MTDLDFSDDTQEGVWSVIGSRLVWDSCHIFTFRMFYDLDGNYLGQEQENMLDDPPHCYTPLWLPANFNERGQPCVDGEPVKPLTKGEIADIMLSAGHIPEEKNPPPPASREKLIALILDCWNTCPLAKAASHMIHLTAVSHGTATGNAFFTDDQLRHVAEAINKERRFSAKLARQNRSIRQ